MIDIVAEAAPRHAASSDETERQRSMSLVCPVVGVAKAEAVAGPEAAYL